MSDFYFGNGKVMNNSIQALAFELFSSMARAVGS